jgi:uncharacterized small protein (DUF1192 family)
VLGKLAKLSDADLLAYNERQERIAELCAELKQLQAKHLAFN